MQKHRLLPLRRLQDPRWWWTSMVTSGLVQGAIDRAADDTSAPERVILNRVVYHMRGSLTRLTRQQQVEITFSLHASALSLSLHEIGGLTNRALLRGARCPTTFQFHKQSIGSRVMIASLTRVRRRE